MGFAKIINAFKDKRILIIGDLILDRFIYGKVNRISPEAPVPVVEVVSESFLLGGAANVANNVIALGGNVSIAGIVGKDTAGRILKELFEERNINIEGLIEDKRPTTVKTRVIAHHQQVVRFDREDRKRLDGKNLLNLTNYIKKALKEHDAVIISDYKKGVISSSLIRTVVKHAKQNNTFVAVDPKVGHFHFYKNVSLITPNLMEASQGSGVEIKDEPSLLKAGKTLMTKLSCRSVLITRSEDGMSLFERDESKKIKTTHIPTAAKKVFDVTGAGDTVIAAITLAHVAGASLEQAAVIANHAAGIVVGEVGTAVVTPERLMTSLQG
ncbi:RfaE bifunctional protein, domain I [Dissulfurispira thermophila]|uniref:RfaE bifunctional protein, domain I n=1 Tax=Dissulfurispira thermophila TaxID=2715679 RepID=A0A7G1GYY7_9BACT|nr:D-glycero-beta-D-manno-heptose-7-phosphate kinase [Dissulfurispira thermophila]BCB95126.1 RfaE bifunctional protein, domain I [Dissulfurispira thermophila]